MTSRIEKSIARFLAVELAPECGEVLSDFRVKRDGWVKMPEEIERVCKGLNLGAYYVVAYEDERRIHSCLYKALFPEDFVEELLKLDAEFMALSEVEKLAMLKEDLDSPLDETLGFSWEDFFPKTEAAREAARLQYESLSEEEKRDAAFRLAMLIAFFYSFFYNNLSLMVHGQKLTTLVPLALQGDKEAFCKAVQIDRNLLDGHPYFRDTYARLRAGEDKDFLDAVLYRIGNPTTRGKIRFPALYMVFTLLDGFGWLEEFTASELLDICDEAKLDRFQSRIEDENKLIKRRLEYRRFQKVNK
jgi:hypothetical protein